jgi:hypothetical protein
MSRKDTWVLVLLLLVAVIMSRIGFIRNAVGRIAPISFVEWLLDITSSSPSSPLTGQKSVSLKYPPKYHDSYNEGVHHQKVCEPYSYR